jgi:hypothetical protein
MVLLAFVKCCFWTDFILPDPFLRQSPIEADVRYPTTDGANLYQIAQLVPTYLRKAFETGLGQAHEPYRTEVNQCGAEPVELPIRDILAIYLNLGFMPTAALHDGYRNACRMGHKQAFWDALALRNEKALEQLKLMITERKLPGMVLVPRLPKYHD